MKTECDFTVGSGNVFADLLLSEAEEARAKADLAHAINEVIEHRGWTQRQTAAVLGLDQPKVSALRRGRLTGCSFERLLRLLNALNQDVVMSVRPKASSQPRANIIAMTDKIGHAVAADQQL